MRSFESDYLEGAHPKILEALMKTNYNQVSGYGDDQYTKEAKKLIKKELKMPDAQIQFLVGGTQTNQVVISALLAPYQGVFAADTGHINTHEAGAIEITGHKVLPLPSKDGKISADSVVNYLTEFNKDANKTHMVFPKMVYISYPTEYGTLYSKAELTALYKVCQDNGLYLFIDGARLGYGLMSKESDLTMAELANLCDVFYIGGTKQGALLGEAVVFSKAKMPEQFITMVKQRGALLAKGRVLGIQFKELFTDNLYFDLAKKADDLADKVKQAFLGKGYKLFYDSPTNQQFVIVSEAEMNKLAKKVKFYRWERYDEDHWVIRFVINWATTKEAVDELISLI